METVTNDANMENMADYEKSFKKLETGEFVKGKVVKIDSDSVLVDIGYKSEAVIPFNEISLKPFKAISDAVNVGDEIDVMVLKTESRDGHPIVSKKKADIENEWKNVVNSFKNNETMSGACIEKIRGGLLVNIGITGMRAFLPGSLADIKPLADLGELVGEVLNFKIIQVDEDDRNVVVSRRKCLEEDRLKMRDELWNNIYEGAILTGKVVRIADFGAFVDLGGMDGLIHISELSYTRVKHTQDIVNVGDQVEVVVIGVDKEKRKIGLSLRQTKPDPWLTVEEKFKAGDCAEAVVTRVVKNYVFAEIIPGIEGLIPVNELSLDKFAKAEDVVKADQKIKVKIIDIKPLERRILLSASRIESDNLKEEYKPFLSEEKTGSFTVGDLLKNKMKGL